MSTIYTTFIERESCFIKVWGQKEKNISLFIENALMQMKPQFDAGLGMLSVEMLQPGLLCCAKFKNHSYYNRARITNLMIGSQGMVEVLFIDYGNRDLVHISNLRTISNFPPTVVSMPEQAKAFILARIQVSTCYPDQGFEMISNEIRYLDFEYQFVGQAGPYSLLMLKLGGIDIVENLITRRLAIPIEISNQLMMLQNIIKAAPQQILPAQQLKMAQQRSPPMTVLQQPAPMSPGLGSQPNFLTFKSLPLQVGSEHTVYVSYVTDGPCLFSIQLQNKEQELQELMFEVNKVPLVPIEENILPGCVCLARSSEDDYICRAVITNMVEDKYKVFFVDFGNTEMRSFADIFQIPFKYVIPKVMATRFALNGLQSQVVSLDMKVAFKTFVDNKALKMRVCSPFPKTGISVCDLWNAEGISALDFVRGASLQAYPEPVPLTRGLNKDVKVSYVFSCVKFYVQLSKKEAELNQMMQELQAAPMSPITLDLIKVNGPCIALYQADGMYYRAQILSAQGDTVLVKYVDYGNEENIPIKDIRAPMMEFITNLRPQAIECCLNGYQNMENDQERDNLLEELMLEQYFSMKVADVQASRILVELFDAQLYNVASLLLDRMAKNRSQISPALVQDNKIDHRKTAPVKYSPRDNKTDSWRDNNRQRPPSSTDWRQARDKDNSHQNSADRDGNNFDSRRNANPWGDRNNQNSGDGGESNSHQERRRQNFGDDKRPQKDWSRSDQVKSPKSSDWGDDKKRNNNNWNDNKRENHKEFKKRSPRGTNNDDGSEKSFESKRSFTKTKTDNWSPPKKNFDENVDYADLDAQLPRMGVVGTEKKASVSWFYNPANFFLQVLDDKAKFDGIMKDIQYAYKKRTPLASAEVGNFVIAQFPEDKGLYRAEIIQKNPLGSYKVRYVDFGNTAVTNRIFKVEKRFMELPVQAVQCGLPGVQPIGEKWQKADDFGKYFGEDVMDCTFLGVTDDIYSVDMRTKGKSLIEELQKAALVLVKNPYEHFDITYLISQQIFCKVQSVNALNDFVLEILPGLTVPSVIFKHEVATTPDLECLKSLINGMVVAYVDDVQENKIFVTLYNTKGNFLPIIELQEEMFDIVNPISPTLIIGPYLNGFVAHATSTCVFVQVDYTAKQVDLLLDQLFSCYETSEAVDIEVKEVIYAVKSSDDNWYRGLVKKIEGDDVTVQFIDYGNEEVVNKSALRLLSDDFFLPYLASEIAIENAESLLEKDIRLKVTFQDDKWVGEVVIEETPALQETKPVAPVEVVNETAAMIEETPQPLVPVESQPLIGFPVELSHLDNPGQFYLQQSSALDTIALLQEDLQQQIESLTDIETITTGIICAAPYSVDQVWYRAQVLDADSDITTVRFIDYGNTDVLGSDTKIKTLPTELLSLEEHAKRCSLSLSPVNNEWTSEACTRFEALAPEGVPLSAEIVHQDEKTTFVRLYADNVCINDIFIAEGFATELQAPEADFKGFVSNLNSPSEFWLQFEHACSELEWIADQLVNADKFKLLEDQAPGSLCAAIFPEDESWYRARILSNTVAGVEVLFIDYGNSCTCTSLRELPEDLVMVPAFAHKCSLVKPPGILEWSQKAAEKFKEISADGVTVFTVIKHAQGETNQVQLLLNNQDISELLKPELFEAKVLSCNSLAEFAIRKVECNAKFDEADVTELRQVPQDIKDIEPLALTVKMNPMVGYAFNAESESYFKTLCESDELFHVEIVSDKVVRLYLNGVDVREQMPMTKCSPLSSVQSTPKKVKAAEVVEVNANAEEKFEDAEEKQVEVNENAEEKQVEVHENAEKSQVEGNENAEERQVEANGNAEERQVEVHEDAEKRQVEGNENAEEKQVEVNVNAEEKQVEVHENAEEKQVEVKENTEEKQVIEKPIDENVEKCACNDEETETDVMVSILIPSSETGVNLEEEMKAALTDDVEETKMADTHEPTKLKETDPIVEDPQVTSTENGKTKLETSEEPKLVQDQDDQLLKDAEMITSVTDELINKVAKHCNLPDDSTNLVDKNATETILNGKSEISEEIPEKPTSETEQDLEEDIQEVKESQSEKKEEESSAPSVTASS